MSTRIDRSQYTLDDALREIALAEAILDGMGAEKGKTLWGRIASVKRNMQDTTANNQTDEDRVTLYHVIGQRAEYHDPGVTLEDALNSTRRGEAYAELKVVSVTQVVGTGYYLIPANDNDTQEVSK